VAEESRFQGLRVLIAEDNLLAAMELQQALVDLGCQPVGPVAAVGEAMQLVRRERLDAALLDVDLRGERVFAVAEELARQGVPVIFASGYDGDHVFPEAFLHHRRLRKPFGESELRRALEDAIRPGAAPQPKPDRS
jgi:CheY-like chemotaxis protein